MKWIKGLPSTPKSQVFFCPHCKQRVHCNCPIGKVNICNYKYCPHCGKEVEPGYPKEWADESTDE